MTEIIQQRPQFPGATAPRLVDPRQGGHIVRFYDDDQVLAAAVADFLAEGLAAREALLVIATPGHVELIEETLSARGFDLPAARAARQLTILDAADALNLFFDGEEPDWERFNAEIGGAVARSIATSPSGRVRAYGEMVDLLARKGLHRAALRLEEFWHRLQGQYPVSLLCGYVMGSFFSESQSADFRRVCDAHDHVFAARDLGTDPDARERQISQLLQRALSLETELLRRKQREEALRIAREHAEAASRAKDEFLAMLGHELRNPLSPILTALELIKLRGDGHFTHEHAVVERQARHLVRLVDDLLDVSRVARGVLELRRQRVDLRDVLAKAIDMASPLLEARRHHFQVQAPPRGAVVMEADEARLAQVMANLLTNAAKYTPVGGHISIRAQRAGGELELEVRDDGIGIAPDLLPNIFDLFVQGRQSIDRGEGGLGIGLALVRSLVQLHGGSVAVHSDGSGKGSVFTVRLPAEDPSDVKGRAARARPAPASSGRRILLVDDNEDAAAMLAEILMTAGHEVRTAGDGPTALESALSFRPDVAVLDIGLPAMDGYELATRLRAQAGGTAPILIALSGYGQESDRARSEAVGFAEHLVKPVDASELLSTIEARLRS
jgi:signal transduction histidine kinase